jgi:hypothetical protein
VNREFKRTLFAVRYVLPAALVIAGLTAMVINPHGIALEGGMGLIGAGLAALLFGYLARMSMSDPSRDREEAARLFFDEHGHWPDEDPSAAERRRPRSAGPSA